MKPWTHLALWIQERPAPLLEEPLWVVNDGLHDLGPVQRLDALCVLDVTRAKKEKTEKRKKY